MKKSNPGQKHKCKEMYFEYKSVEDIVSATSVNRSTLLSWVNGRMKNDPESWRFQRDSHREEIIRDRHGVRILKIEEILSMTADFVAYSLQERINKRGPNGKPIPFSYKENVAASQVALNMKKMGNLEEGLPTEILGMNATLSQAPTRSVTVIELREAIKKDPFLIGILPQEESKEDNGNTILLKSDESKKWDELLDGPGIQGGSDQMSGNIQDSESSGDGFGSSVNGSSEEDDF